MRSFDLARESNRELGNLLMGIAGELEKLDELHTRGTLTDDEFSRAKSNLLTPNSPVGSHEIGTVLHDQLLELKRQNEISQLDREWDQLDRSYLFIGPYGRLYRPTVLMGFFIAFSGSLFGIVWVAIACFMATAMHTLSPYAVQFGIVNDGIFLIGVVIILASLARGLYLCFQAVFYHQAYAAYRRKRAQLVSRPV